VTERDELIALWAETERDLRAALGQVDIGLEATRSVVEYLNHNELGLAFSTLVESLDQLGTSPPPATMGYLSAANVRMGGPPDGRDAWESLQRRAES
jgi:hypothetical protein